MPRHIQRALKATIATVLCGSASGFFVPAHAQVQQEMPATELVVVASRLARDPDGLASAVTVLEREQIDTAGYLVLSELLAQQAGVSQSRNGGAGATTALRIRGEEGYRTLMVVDGIRISDPSAPQTMPHAEHLTGAGLQRVELLRGPQGLAWGADAGGVILIETLARPGESRGLQADIHASAGSLDTAAADFTLAGSGDRLSAVLGGSHLDTAGYNQSLADTTGERDGYRNDTVHAGLRAGFGDSLTISLAGRSTEAHSDYDQCFGTAPSNTCRSGFNQDAARLGLGFVTRAASHELSWQMVNTDRSYSAGTGNVFATDGQLERVDYTAGAELTDRVTLAWGADWQRADSGEFVQVNTGVYAELIAEPGDGLTVTAGLRRDDNPAFGQHDTYRAGFAWLRPLANGVLKWRGSAGTGFRAPSPFEQAYNDAPFAFEPAASAVLMAESSRGLEAGVDFVGTSLEMGFTLFSQQVTDAIEFDVAGFSGYVQPQGVSRSKGAELTAGYAFDTGWLVEGSYTWNDARQTDGEQRLRRPRSLFNLALAWRAESSAWHGRLAWRHVGSQTDVGQVQLDGFDVADAIIGRQFGRRQEVFLQVANLLDSGYQELAGYPAPGRTFRAGFRMRLGH